MTKRCGWCDDPIPARSATGRLRRLDSDYCSKRCRQTAFRLRKRLEASAGPHASPGAGDERQLIPAGATRRRDRRDPSRATAAPGDASRPMRLAYADPPYPGLARRYYGGDGDPFDGDVDEVDHAKLISDLEREHPDGWALSTGAYALADLLPLCPPYPETRVCAWVKPHAPGPRTHGIHNCWEPLIVVRGRQTPPGRRDWLQAHAARFGGDLMGRKPIAFVAWMLEMLGADPAQDELADLFPGTGVVSRAWANLQREASRAADGDASPEARGDASATLFDAGQREASLSAAAPGDASALATGDPSPAPGDHDDESRAA